MNHVSAQSVDERMINVHYCYIVMKTGWQTAGLTSPGRVNVEAAPDLLKYISSQLHLLQLLLP